MKLIHTDFIRLTLTQEVRVIIPPIDVTKYPQFRNCHRKVQIFIPQSPKFTLDNDILPEEIGPNRTYKMPPVPPNVPVRFHLRLDQFIVGAVDDGFGETSALIEFWKEE